MKQDRRDLLRHLLAALAYRTQKAIRGAPHAYWSFQAGNSVQGPLSDAMTHAGQLASSASTAAPCRPRTSSKPTSTPTTSAPTSPLPSALTRSGRRRRRSERPYPGLAGDDR